LDGEFGQAVGGGIVDAAAIGLESLRATLPAVRTSKRSQQYATPSGSPPPKAP
jgi:hypothetical protein